MYSILEYLVIAAIAIVILVVGVQLLPTAIAGMTSIVLGVLPSVVVIWFTLTIIKALGDKLRD